ncbi:c-type cytochrome [Erythrobacter arachoides]|uniref:C-type cytochrome n=2 Tax=Aurantiacibacter arachoides TaxID=1850444 RepID=A0A844ZYE3_9SPHN|nr:c-type cytochrome [Aurantiacibacter arachoides]MXO92262.1 c-type cytochrome [Aurantiacibacter arachoides]
MNTIFGWLLASAGIALGGSIVAGMYFHGDGQRLEDDFAWGYVIEAAEGGAAEAEVEPIGNRLAVADLANGEATFARCQSCHQVAAGPSGLGPNLNGVIGSAIGGHASDFSYSSAIKEHGGQWSYENLDEWLRSPSGFIPGNQMSFPGLADPQARADLIAYLHAAGGGGPDFPPPVEAAPAEGEADATGATDTADQNQPGEEAGAQATDGPVSTGQAATANQNNT